MPAPYTKFTNLDFDQIKTSIKDYLRANSNFTDFDFEGSNFSILIDTLAYNTYINAFNSNMVVNESFLDSATVRQNVVSLARQIGYVPRSRTASKAQIYFDVPVNTTSPTVTLEANIVCVGSVNDTSYIFSIPESITTTVNNGVASFGSESDPIDVYEGRLLSFQFPPVNGSLDQKFILDNPYIDTSTLVIRVKGSQDSGFGEEYKQVDNIVEINKNSKIYLIQEVQDEKYEIIFGDGVFGKKLENGAIITATYIVTDGKDGNGASNFSFAGTFTGSSGESIVPTSGNVIINTRNASSNGGDIESINSIKYFAPRLYSSQYRAVTSRDYESVIQSIYPNTESISVVGGENLSPPKYGTVIISIKPKNGDYVSDFDKQLILTKLKNYSVSGINAEINDIKVLYVEIDSSVYYNSSEVSTVENLKTNILKALDAYANSVDLNKFGGRFKYSRILQTIDNVDRAVTSNITKVIIRRNLKALVNQFAQYELCFGNQFHINPEGFNIKSTGFKVSGSSDTLYFTDIPNTISGTGLLDNSGMGTIAAVRLPTSENSKYTVILKSIGTVNYMTGEIVIGTIDITSTERDNDIIEIQAFPESNDIIGLNDLYLNFNVGASTINMVRDTVSSGDQISGVGYKVTSSYSTGNLIRK